MKRKLRKIKKHSSNYMILILKNLKQDLGKKIKNAFYIKYYSIFLTYNLFMLNYL